MKTDENSNHLIAAEGKVLRRISDGWIAGKDIYLGYAYYLNGEILPERLLELPEHYEEVDEPVENIIADVEDVDFDEVVEPEAIALLANEAVPAEEPRPTLADLLVRALSDIAILKGEVEELKGK